MHWRCSAVAHLCQSLVWLSNAAAATVVHGNWGRLPRLDMRMYVCTYERIYNAYALNSNSLKLKFHGTDTDTDTDTDFLAEDPRAEVDVSGARGSRSAAARAARSARRHVGGLLSDTRAFARDDVRWGCARVDMYVYCT